MMLIAKFFYVYVYKCVHVHVWVLEGLVVICIRYCMRDLMQKYIYMYVSIHTNYIKVLYMVSTVADDKDAVIKSAMLCCT